MYGIEMRVPPLNSVAPVNGCRSYLAVVDKAGINGVCCGVVVLKRLFQALYTFGCPPTQADFHFCPRNQLFVRTSKIVPTNQT